MNFYTQQHKHYYGIDLHTQAMYICILDQGGTILVHKNLPTTPEAFLRVIAPYREDGVGGVECMFTWYWLADLCQQEGIAFVLGHALYMKAIHGGKAKNDKIDAHKIAVLLRGGVMLYFSIYYLYDSIASLDRLVSTGIERWLRLQCPVRTVTAPRS